MRTVGLPLGCLAIRSSFNVWLAAIALSASASSTRLDELPITNSK